MPIDLYARYCDIMRQVYGAACPLPSRERWNAAAGVVTFNPARDFDIETEQRDGWAYQDHENHNV